MSKQRHDKEGETSHELGFFPDVNRNNTDRFLVRPMKDKGFEYRKSIFATIFAITLAMAIIFTILYTRCSTNYIKNESECDKCHIDADCFHLQHNIKRCQCKLGFIGDGKYKCNEIREKFLIPMSSEMLLSKTPLKFREAREMTICLRYKIISFMPNESLIILESFDGKNEDPILGIYKTYSDFIVQLKDSKLQVSIGNDYINRSEHICLQFNTTGTWRVFINGELYSSGIAKHIRKLPSTEVNVSIGEKPKDNKKSRMEISEFLLYSEMVSVDEIYDIEKLRIKYQNVVMSWDQFHESFLDSK